MKRLILILLSFLALGRVGAQNTLFDDFRVSSIYILINPDSLNYIMTNVLSEHYFTAKFVYDHGTGKDTLDQVGFRLRGNTSRYSAKKSFKISFNEYIPGRKYQEVKKINLNGQHNDPTMIREKLFYEVWKKTGLPERRASFVRLYINGAYYGLYTNLEELDKQWLGRVYPENEGNLYKCTYPADLVFINGNQDTYKNIESGSVTGGRAYDLQTNETTDDYSDLVSLITLLSLPADSAFAANISQLLDVDEVLKAFALDVASGNWDDYMYNKNNYFLYHNQLTGKFEFIAYDTDNTFGVDWMNRDWATRNCLDWVSHSEARPLATKLLAIPEFNLRYKAYLDTIARYIIVPDSVFPVIEAYHALITSAAGEDQYRTLDFGYTMNDFHDGFIKSVDSHTPYGIKPFLELRQTKILEQLGANGISKRRKTSDDIQFYPNPVQDRIVLHTSLKETKANYAIFDQQGKQVLKGNVEAPLETIEIEVRDLTKGAYILRIIAGSRTYNYKFMKF